VTQEYEGSGLKINFWRNETKLRRMAARSKTVRYVKTNLCWITKKQNTHR